MKNGSFDSSKENSSITCWMFFMRRGMVPMWRWFKESFSIRDPRSEPTIMAAQVNKKKICVSHQSILYNPREITLFIQEFGMHRMKQRLVVEPKLIYKVKLRI